MELEIPTQSNSSIVKEQSLYGVQNSLLSALNLKQITIVQYFKTFCKNLPLS